MRSLKETNDLAGGAAPGLLGVIAAFGEEVAAEPENLRGALRKMAVGLRDVLGLGAVSISVGEGREVLVSCGSGRLLALVGPPQAAVLVHSVSDSG